VIHSARFSDGPTRHEVYKIEQTGLRARLYFCPSEASNAWRSQTASSAGYWNDILTAYAPSWSGIRACCNESSLALGAYAAGRGGPPADSATQGCDGDQDCWSLFFLALAAIAMPAPPKIITALMIGDTVSS